MEKTGKDRLKLGDAAPDFTLPAVDGHPVSLSGITSAGNRALLVFLRNRLLFRLLRPLMRDRGSMTVRDR